jgi:hypothetical protein
MDKKQLKAIQDVLDERIPAIAKDFTDEGKNFSENYDGLQVVILTQIAVDLHRIANVLEKQQAESDETPTA